MTLNIYNMNNIKFSIEEIQQINQLLGLLRSQDAENQFLGYSMLKTAMLSDTGFLPKIRSLYRVSKQGKIGGIWGYIQICNHNLMEKNKDANPDFADKDPDKFKEAFIQAAQATYYTWDGPLIYFLQDLLDFKATFVEQVFIDRDYE